MKIALYKSNIFSLDTLESLHVNLFFIVSFTLFFPQLHFIFYIFYFVSLVKIITLKKYKKPLFVKENLPFFLILLFIIWNVTSLTYSLDFSEGLKRIEKLVPIALISIIGLFTDKNELDFSKSKMYYLYGAFFSIAISLLFVTYQFFFGHLKGVALTKGIMAVNFLNIYEHRLYIGVLLLMVLPNIFDHIFNTSSKSRTIIWILILSIFFFVIYSTGSRILVLVFSLLSAFLIYNELKKRIRKSIFFILFVIIGGLLVSIIYLHPRTNLTFYLLKNNKELHKIDSRIRIWECSYELWLEDAILGKGIGDAKKGLLEKYIKKGYLLEHEKEYNAHNQFLETSIQSGIIGLFFLCIIFIGFLYNGNIYASCFLVVIISSFLIESFLNRNLGTFAFSYWVFSIFIYIKKETKETTNFSKIPAFFTLLVLPIFLLLLTSNMRAKLNSKNPETYLSIPFNEIEFEAIPNKEMLPQKTKAASINNKRSFKKFEYGYFVAPEIYSGNSDTYSTIEYGIWCYVSENSNVRRVYAYAWDKIDKEYKEYYDINKKGTWQYLKLSDMKFTGVYSLGIRLDLYRETEKMSGEILFALPKYNKKPKN